MAGFQNNPAWDESEIILAMDLYYNHKSDTKHGSSEEFRELSETLRMLKAFDDVAEPDKYRNPAGVGTKIGNLQYLDAEDPAKGLSSVSSTDRKVWEKYKGKPEEVHRLALAIRASINAPEMQLTITDEDCAAFPEGHTLYKMHKFRERNGAVVKAKKLHAAENGELICEVCGFDFEETYGDLGKGFIEAHHIQPLSEYSENDTTTEDDLALVCSNCHRMLHRKRPWITPNELKCSLR